MSSNAAELRLVRIMAGVIAVGAALFCWLSLGAIASQAPFARPGWSPVAVAAVFGVPIVVAALMPISTLPVARALLSGTAALYLLTAFSELFLVSPIPHPESHWALNNTAIATSSAALALPRSWAWGYNGIVSFLVLASRARGGGDALLPGIQDGLYSFMFCAIFLALAQLTLDRVREVDEGTRTATRHAAVVAAARARQAERSRVDALLHDTVLAALMLASRSGDRLDESVRRQAAEAAAALAAEAAGEVEESDLVELLRERVARVEEGVPAVLPAHAVRLPGPVAEALADAAAEAVRNALRHAGLGDRRPAVELEAGDSAVVVSVRDDGTGFEPGAVPAGRLGLRWSVFGRLESIPGGSAQLESAPGAGTTVRLRWEREPS